MDKKDKLNSQISEVTISAAGALVGFAVGGPLGAVVAGTATSASKLAYNIIEKWTIKRNKRIIGLVEKAFTKSEKNEDEILKQLDMDEVLAEDIVNMIRELFNSEPKLDAVFVEIISSMIKDNNQNQRKRLQILSDAIKGLRRIQVQILLVMYNAEKKLSASEISREIDVPEVELRNTVRDLELRGMIIDNGCEPTIWELRELGYAVAKIIAEMEVNYE